MARRAAALLAIALLAACGGSEAGPTPTPTPTPNPQNNEFMSPGSDCLSCHGPGGAATAKFTAAGTVYTSASGTTPAAGIEVWIGGVKVATTNAAGNFFTTAALGSTIGSISVNNLNDPNTKRTMATVATTGSCNGCHAAGSVYGRVHFP